MNYSHAERNKLLFELSVYTHTVIRKLSEKDLNLDSSSKILFVLQVQQPTSLKNLCDILGVSASAGSIMLDKYVKAGLVMRSPDPVDRRKVVLSLTDEGTQLVNQYTVHLNQNLDEAMSALSDKENQEFFNALATTSSYLHKLFPHLIGSNRQPGQE